jgi:hypothetical protein
LRRGFDVCRRVHGSRGGGADYDQASEHGSAISLLQNQNGGSRRAVRVP